MKETSKLKASNDRKEADLKRIKLEEQRVDKLLSEKNMIMEEFLEHEYSTTSVPKSNLSSSDYMREVITEED